MDNGTVVRESNSHLTGFLEWFPAIKLEILNNKEPWM